MLTQRLFRSAASRVVISLAGIVVSFLLTPFIIGHLGSDGYGLWLLVSAITAIYAVMDLGLSVATQRAVAQALATGCTDVANEFVNTAFVSFCGVSAVILLATVVAVAEAPLIVKTGARVYEFRVVVSLLATSIIFLFPTYAVSGVYSATFRYDIVSGIHLVRILTRALLVYIAIVLGGRLIAMAAVTTLTDVGAGGAMVIVAHRLAPWLKWQRKYFASGRLRELVSFGGWYLVVTLCARGTESLPAFATNAIAGLTAVTFFGIAQQVYSLSVQIVTNVFGVFLPLFVRQQSSQDHSANERDFRLVTQLGLSVAVVMAVGVVGCGADFIRTWLGAKYDESLEPMYILVILGVFSNSMQSVTQLLFAYSMQAKLAILSACELLVSASLMYPLAKEFGLNGIAVAMVAPAVISRAFIQPLMAKRRIKIDISGHFSRVLRAAVLLALGSIVILRVQPAVPGSGYLKVLWMGLISLAVAAPMAYMLCLDGEAKGRLASAAAGLLLPRSRVRPR